MAKIGRNQPCPCGSGRKYKHCCLHGSQAAPPVSTEAAARISLVAAIERIQRAAASHRERLRELGVFIFFSNSDGDAWLLEVTDSDAVQVARGGEALDVPINEDPERIEINWSHTFAIRQRRFYLTSYATKEEVLLENVPCKRIRAAIRRIYKQYSPELLNQVHITGQEGEQAA